MKGLRDIATLIASPGKAVHSFDLSDHVQSADGGDQVLDEKARQAYQARIRDLQEDIAAGEDANDSEGVERAQTEMDALMATLSNALGLSNVRSRLSLPDPECEQRSAKLLKSHSRFSNYASVKFDLSADHLADFVRRLQFGVCSHFFAGLRYLNCTRRSGNDCIPLCRRSLLPSSCPFLGCL